MEQGAERRRLFESVRQDVMPSRTGVEITPLDLDGEQWSAVLRPVAGGADPLEVLFDRSTGRTSFENLGGRVVEEAQALSRFGSWHEALTPVAAVREACEAVDAHERGVQRGAVSSAGSAHRPEPPAARSLAAMSFPQAAGEAFAADGRSFTSTMGPGREVYQGVRPAPATRLGSGFSEGVQR